MEQNKAKITLSRSSSELSQWSSSTDADPPQPPYPPTTKSLSEIANTSSGLSVWSSAKPQFPATSTGKSVSEVSYSSSELSPWSSSTEAETECNVLSPGIEHDQQEESLNLITTDAVVPKERKKWQRPPLVGQADRTGAATKTEVSSSLVSREAIYLSPSQRNFDIVKARMSEQSSSLDSRPASVSSAASARPLEWDNSADLACPYPHESPYPYAHPRESYLRMEPEGFGQLPKAIPIPPPLPSPPPSFVGPSPSTFFPRLLCQSTPVNTRDAPMFIPSLKLVDLLTEDISVDTLSQQYGSLDTLLSRSTLVRPLTTQASTSESTSSVATVVNQSHISCTDSSGSPNTSKYSDQADEVTKVVEMMKNLMAGAKSQEQRQDIFRRVVTELSFAKTATEKDAEPGEISKLNDHTIATLTTASSATNNLGARPKTTVQTASSADGEDLGTDTKTNKTSTSCSASSACENLGAHPKTTLYASKTSLETASPTDETQNSRAKLNLKYFFPTQHEMSHTSKHTTGPDYQFPSKQTASSSVLLQSSVVESYQDKDDKAGGNHAHISKRSKGQDTENTEKTTEAGLPQAMNVAAKTTTIGRQTTQLDNQNYQDADMTPRTDHTIATLTTASSATNNLGARPKTTVQTASSADGEDLGTDTKTNKTSTSCSASSACENLGAHPKTTLYASKTSLETASPTDETQNSRAKLNLKYFFPTQHEMSHTSKHTTGPDYQFPSKQTASSSVLLQSSVVESYQDKDDKAGGNHAHISKRSKGQDTENTEKTTEAGLPQAMNVAAKTTTMGRQTTQLDNQNYQDADMTPRTASEHHFLGTIQQELENLANRAETIQSVAKKLQRRRKQLTQKLRTQSPYNSPSRRTRIQTSPNLSSSSDEKAPEQTKGEHLTLKDTQTLKLSEYSSSITEVDSQSLFSQDLALSTNTAANKEARLAHWISQPLGQYAGSDEASSFLYQQAKHRCNTSMTGQASDVQSMSYSEGVAYPCMKHGSEPKQALNPHSTVIDISNTAFTNSTGQRCVEVNVDIKCVKPNRSKENKPSKEENRESRGKLDKAEAKKGDKQHCTNVDKHKRPKAIFTIEVRDGGQESSLSDEQSPRASLQEMLQQHRPDFIHKAERRRECLQQLSHRRLDRTHQRREMLRQSVNKPAMSKPEDLLGAKKIPPTPMSQMRLFKQTQMTRATRLKAARLEENKTKKEKEKRRQDYAVNMLMGDIYQRKLQKRVVHKKKTDLSNSVSVISSD